MTTSSATETGKNLAVTSIGVLTFLWGVAHAITGGWVVYGGIALAVHAIDNPWGPLITLFGLVPVLAVLIGIALFVLGVLAIIAGPGVLGRRQWARIMTFVVAPFAILMGLLW